MSASREANERRALAVAQADFDERMPGTTGYRASVKTENGRYLVSYLRSVAEGEPMILDVRGASIEYEINQDFEIERVSQPR